MIQVISNFLAQKEAFLRLAKDSGTPAYVFDRKAFAGALDSFNHAFTSAIPEHRAFYAIKSNRHPYLLQAAISHGFGLDVSSRVELEEALRIGALNIVFSGPAKTERDLTLALDNSEKVLIHLDSFSELKKLGQLTKKLNRRIRAGVRFYTNQHGEWSKFGIPLSELAHFWSQAKEFPNIDLCAVQMHRSGNVDFVPYANIVTELGQYLRTKFNPQDLASIKIVDLGGGFLPNRIAGDYLPVSPQPTGRLEVGLSAYSENSPLSYQLRSASTALEYAVPLGKAIDSELRPILACEAYYTEPGRIVSSFAMHILLKVVDVKRSDFVIVDGGINMVGWERYLHNYYPVINLTHPAEKEISISIGGSLCDTEDYWGFHCYSNEVQEGDILLIPNQGAYTYCLAQSFIREIPPVVSLD